MQEKCPDKRQHGEEPPLSLGRDTVAYNLTRPTRNVIHGCSRRRFTRPGTAGGNKRPRRSGLSGGRTEITTLRTHFTFPADTWTPDDGESIVEHVAGVEDYQVELATFRAALTRANRSQLARQRCF
jgi:hypothetical protein